jgi:hypothetical protein
MGNIVRSTGYMFLHRPVEPAGIIGMWADQAQCNSENFLMATTPSIEQARERTIEAWMLRIVQDDGVARFDDLQINQIDKL